MIICKRLSKKVASPKTKALCFFYSEEQVYVRPNSIRLFSGSVTVIVLLLLVGLEGCSSSQRFGRTEVEERRASASSPKNVEETRAIAAPTSGRVLLTLEGIASYYADDFHGKQTSNGEMFDMNALTAAHRTFPFDSMVRVTNLDNSMSVVVRVNDRGPFVDGRIIDLSLGAAKEIGLIAAGTARVKLEVLKWGEGTLKHK